MALKLLTWGEGETEKQFIGMEELTTLINLDSVPRRTTSV